MENINIQEKDGKITHSIEQEHDLDSLANKYRDEFIASSVQNAKIEQLPQVIAGIDLHVDMINKQIVINEQKQKQIFEIFKDRDFDIKKEVQVIRDTYKDDELLKRAEILIQGAKSEIIKQGSRYIFKTEVTQTEEDMLIELMSLGDQKSSLLEELIKQTKSLETQKENLVKFNKSKAEIVERMNAIKVFFAKQHIKIDDYLDQQSAARTKTQRTAQTLK